jgi:hypothetical protein
MSKIFVANVLSRLSTYKTKKTEQDVRPKLLLPQHRIRLCCQKYLKYLRCSTNYYGSTTAALVQ